MANTKWKLPLLPKKDHRRKSSGVPLGPATSPLDSDFDTNRSAATKMIIDHQVTLDPTRDAFDNKLVSALLETTNESEVSPCGHPAKVDAEQLRQLARSRTFEILSGVDTFAHQILPQSPQAPGLSIEEIPRRSSSWNNCHESHHVPDASLPNKKRKGPARPLPQSQSAHIMGCDVAQNSQMLFGSSANTRRVKARDVDHNRDKNSAKIVLSRTTVLSTPQEATNRAKDATDPTGSFKVTRSRTRNAFTKLTGALTDHFKSIRGTRKRDHDAIISVNATEVVSTSSAAQGTPKSEPSSNEAHSSLHTSTASKPLCANRDEQPGSQSGHSKQLKVEKQLELAEKAPMMDYELEVCSSQGLEDPFTDSPSAKSLDELRSCAKVSKDTIYKEPSTDPFQTERILDTNVNAILTSPPAGCSTPRRRPMSLPIYETPSKPPRVVAIHKSQTIALSYKISPKKAKRQFGCRTQTQEPQLNALDNDTGHGPGGRKNKPSMEVGVAGAADLTRLSSYPPGSTIRHVPHSMSSLQADLKMAAQGACRSRGPGLSRKKHPSPSKGQLEIFGKCMDKNLSLGVFVDSDELQLGCNTPLTLNNTLSPRDTNRLMRNGNSIHHNHNATTSKSSAAFKPLSRIPKPVRQTSRSRTAHARDFYPANKGDSPTDDELQWEASGYKIGRRCNNCGSMSKVG